MPAAKTNPDLPDYCLDADAVLRDDIPSWRYGRAPDYTNTRKVYRQTKSQDHEPGCPENIIENLVKNWEVEASFKQDINDWRTIDKDNYTFAINGGKAQSAEHMLKVGTYNAVITPNEYYSPEHSDFNSSHKTFKRMMPTFAWEVIEVFGKPPNISFKWRHWGVMKNDYVGFNEAGEKVTVKAHGGQIDFQGLTVAKLTPDLRIQSLDTFFDPIEMFRQIGRGGVIEKVPVGRLGKYKLLPGETHNDYHGMDDHIQKFPENDPLGSGSPPTTPVTKDGGIQRSDTPPEDAPPVPAIPAQFLSGNGSWSGNGNGNGSANEDLPFRQNGDHLHGRPMSPAESYRSTRTHDTISFKEMSKMTPADCPFLMKWRTAGLEQESRASSVMGDDQIGGGGNPWGGIETIVETSEETVVTYE